MEGGRVEVFSRNQWPAILAIQWRNKVKVKSKKWKWKWQIAPTQVPLHLDCWGVFLQPTTRVIGNPVKGQGKERKQTNVGTTTLWCWKYKKLYDQLHYNWFLVWCCDKVVCWQPIVKCSRCVSNQNHTGRDWIRCWWFIRPAIAV